MLKRIEETDREKKLKHVYTVDENGVKQGLYEIYYPYGQLCQKCTYKDGKLEGPFEQYYGDGRIKHKSTYVDGILTGVSESYYESGQVETRCVYSPGIMEYEKYGYGGLLEKKCTWKDSKYEGLYEEYHINGKLKHRCYYTNGRANGPAEYHDRDGTLRSKKFYKDDMLDGPCERYDEDGKFIKTIIYRRGLELKEKEAEEYLKEWQAEQDRIKAEEINRQKREKTLGGLKEKLAEISDLGKVKETIKPARTPERTETLARIVRVRRAKAILSAAAKQAQKEGDTNTLREIVDMAKPYAARDAAIRNKVRLKRAERRVKKDSER